MARGTRNPDEVSNELATLGRRLNLPLPRRALLVLGGQAAVVVALGGLVRLFGGRSTFVRPPGAPTDGALLSRCIKCQKCQEVCPTGVVVSVLTAEDAPAAGTPRLDFRSGYCNLCLKCIDVCPTGVLRPTTKEAVRLGVAEIDKERCVAWAWKGCTECSEKCPYEAITLDSSRRPIIDLSKCNGCGLCEYVCPSSSLRAYTRSRGKGIIVVPPGAEQGPAS